MREPMKTEQLSTDIAPSAHSSLNMIILSLLLMGVIVGGYLASMYR